MLSKGCQPLELLRLDGVSSNLRRVVCILARTTNAMIEAAVPNTRARCCRAHRDFQSFTSKIHVRAHRDVFMGA